MTETLKWLLDARLSSPIVSAPGGYIVASGTSHDIAASATKLGEYHRSTGLSRRKAFARIWNSSSISWTSMVWRRSVRHRHCA
jgi:hypothetical protein